jgi:flagellar hook-associated protein 2
MGISVDGIVSGMDTSGLISKLVAAASTPQNVMKEDLDALGELGDTYDTLTTKLTALQTALEKIDTQAELRSATSTSSDESAVSVTTDGDAVTGRYAISVTSLASSETEVSQGYADKSTAGAIPEGTLNITYAGTTTALTIDSTNSSLEDVAALINEKISGVSAYIMDTGDATAPYRLVIAGLDTGADNSITVDTSGLTGATGTSPSFTETSTAADASLTVNGIAVTSADNEVDGVVDGITFNLQDITSSDVTVTVKTDEDTTVSNIKAFVDAYNDVQGYMRTHRAFSADDGIKGEFVGESLVSNLMQALQRKVADVFKTGATYTSLGSIGFETQQNGDIELDEDMLKEALAASPGEVSALFATDAGGFGDALKDVITMYGDEDEGFIKTRQDAIDDESERLQDDIDAFSERMDAYEQRLRNQFTAMEIALGKLQDAQSQLSALLTTDTSKDKK